MKIIKKGNFYRKLSWFEENEIKIYTVGCIISGIFCFIFGYLILR